jgi:hypothetical protein
MVEITKDADDGFGLDDVQDIIDLIADAIGLVASPTTFFFALLGNSTGTFKGFDGYPTNLAAYKQWVADNTYPRTIENYMGFNVILRAPGQYYATNGTTTTPVETSQAAVENDIKKFIASLTR